MAYVLPQVFVFQEFQASPNPATLEMNAHIAGPHAHLVRYSEATEKEDGFLGYYEPAIDKAYAWPTKPIGSVIDTDYTKLHIQNCLFKYFEDGLSSGSSITKVSGYSNRIVSDSVNFKTNGASYPRDASLYDRDVQLGDIVKVRGLDGGGDPITLWTFVRDILGTNVAATIATLVNDAGNKTNSSNSASISKIAGDDNCVIPTADGSSYDGITSGYLTEVYDIVVIEGSTDGDHTTARLQVLSASGTDNQASVTPAAADTPTAIGTRGLEVTFAVSDSAACSASASSNAVGQDDLVIGQRWQVTVTGDFTAPSAASGGTYSGPYSTTYVVTITRGGLFASATKPQMTITTTTGVDVSGPTNITAAATALPVGSYGATITFTGTGVCKGDRYYITVTKAGVGAMRTIVLGHNLSDEIAGGSEVELTLFILKSSYEVDRRRLGFAPLVNWEQSQAEFTTKSAMIGYDASWTDGGVEMPLDIVSEASRGYGKLYLTYRAWRSDLSDQVYSVNDPGLVDSLISGPNHPDNPLKFGVNIALTNANGSNVLFTACADPESDAAWADVLSKLLEREDAYGLVPLTKRESVLALYEAHINQRSTASNAQWRVGWFAMPSYLKLPIVHAGTAIDNHGVPTTSDGEPALATITDDPNTSGTQHTRLVVPVGNADFVDNGVQPGDIVRAEYTTDGFGSEQYTEYVVDSVISQDELLLVSGPSAAINVAAKIEVWRNLTASQEAAAIADYASSWQNRRISAVGPDPMEASGYSVDGYHMCAALAALSSGMYPHRGMTNTAVAGFTGISRTRSRFSRVDLDVMAEAGVCIVMENAAGDIFVRHAVTTDTSEIAKYEEMIRRNLDNISYQFKDAMEPYIGVTNVTDVVTARLTETVNSLLNELQNSVNNNIGSQVISSTVLSIRPHATIVDRYVVDLQLTLPYATNNIEVRLTV